VATRPSKTPLHTRPSGLTALLASGASELTSPELVVVRFLRGLQQPLQLQEARLVPGEGRPRAVVGEPREEGGQQAWEWQGCRQGPQP